MARRTLAERFWAKVDTSAGPTGCWLWTAWIDPTGYGRIGKEYAHRVAYELCVGPIPKGLQIDHVKERGCTNLHCVNPAHLEAVTPRTNVLRSNAPTAHNAVKTHCKHGHEFTPENTYHVKNPNGRSARHCRKCLNANQQRWYRRRKEAA